MRFYEVAGPRNQFVVTKRFVKEFKATAKSQPAVAEAFAAFVHFRETARADQPFSSKDARFSTSSPLKGYRHVHLIHGKVILVYDIEGSTVKLFTLGTHDAYDTPAAIRSLVDYMNSLDSSGFSPLVSPQKAPEPAVSAAIISEIRDLLYDFASHPKDRKILVRIAGEGYVPAFWEVVLSLLPGDAPASEKLHEILAAFGGQEGFAKTVRDILKQTES